jgi:hypothetical protein
MLSLINFLTLVCNIACVSTKKTYIFYIQSKDSGTGVALYGHFAYHAAVIENDKIKSLEKRPEAWSGYISDKVRQIVEEAALEVRSAEIIPIRRDNYINDYIWVIYEKHPGGKLIETSLGRDEHKAVHIFDSNMKKILTMQDDVQKLHQAGGDLVVTFKFREDIAVVSLKQLTDSGGRIDKTKTIKLSNPWCWSYCITQENIIGTSHGTMYVFDKQNGELIKVIELIDYPLFFILSNETLYWLAFDGRGVYEMNLYTFEYKLITDKEQSGIAIMNNEIILMHKGRLKKTLKLLYWRPPERKSPIE